MNIDEYNKLVKFLWNRHAGADRDDAQRWMRQSSFEIACEELAAKMNIKLTRGKK